jgi:glycosyltransferase involved in cell wall biosynthesis
MERSHKVSIVMSAKNEEKFIGDAISSILHQSYDNLELVVVDDYSTDKTQEVVRSFTDTRIRLYGKKNELPGQACSRNIGITLAKGRLIAYQDADDISAPERIELQVAEFLKLKQPCVIGTWIEERIGTTARVWQLPVSHASIVQGFNRTYNRVTIVSGTILFPRELGLAVPMRPKFRHFEDWDQLCRFYEFGTVEFRNVARSLYRYNIRPKGSKGQRDWTRHNVYERACRARRWAQLPEWNSIEEFEAYLSRSPREYLRWRGLREVLEMKVTIERIRTSLLSRHLT